MALGTQTLTFTINAVPKILTRIRDDGYQSEYLLRGSLDEFRCVIRHAKRNDPTRSNRQVDRHNVELTQTVFATATVPAIVRKAYIVVENDAVDGVTDPLNHDLGFVAFLTSGNLTDLINWVS